jgi:predicted 3-demethylubiquinone-9 3-methyltransferase (glyoxalase superfamily)
VQKVTPFLWFDHQAEEAAQFYVSVFPNSRILEVNRYGDVGPRPKGSVMTVVFELDGQAFTALNAGPQYRFNPAVSFMIDCADQAEVDHYWSKLTAGGEEVACGWLTDKYGLSWQVTPRRLIELVTSPDKAKANRAMEAMMRMKKIDIAALERAVKD